MYAASIGKKQVSKTLKVVLGVAVVAVAAIVVISKVRPREDDVLLDGSTTEKREAYLLSIGIQVDPTSSIAEVMVPEEFDERFAAYNEMLKGCGFDLEPLKGEAVKKCSYTVTNRADLGAPVTVVLLVRDGTIVAGHMVDEASGTLYPLFPAPDAADTTAEETLLPTVTDQSLVTADGTVITDNEMTGETTEVAADAYPTD